MAATTSATNRSGKTGITTGSQRAAWWCNIGIAAITAKRITRATSTGGKGIGRQGNRPPLSAQGGMATGTASGYSLATVTTMPNCLTEGIASRATGSDTTTTITTQATIAQNVLCANHVSRNDYPFGSLTTRATSGIGGCPWMAGRTCVVTVAADSFGYTARTTIAGVGIDCWLKDNEPRGTNC